jgi:hypothetical protein
MHVNVFFCFCLSINGIALAACDYPDGRVFSSSPGAADVPPGCKELIVIDVTYADTSSDGKNTIGPGRPVNFSATGGCPP